MAPRQKSAYLLDEATPSGGILIERMLQSALSPKPGTASPGVCMETLRELEKKLVERKSKRIREAMLTRHAEDAARAAMQEIKKCALGSKCAAKRAGIAARPVTSTRYKVGNNGRRVF